MPENPAPVALDWDRTESSPDAPVVTPDATDAASELKAPSLEWDADPADTTDAPAEEPATEEEPVPDEGEMLKTKAKQYDDFADNFVNNPARTVQALLNTLDEKQRETVLGELGYGQAPAEATSKYDMSEPATPIEQLVADNATFIQQGPKHLQDLTGVVQQIVEQVPTELGLLQVAAEQAQAGVEALWAIVTGTEFKEIDRKALETSLRSGVPLSKAIRAQVAPKAEVAKRLAAQKSAPRPTSLSPSAPRAATKLREGASWWECARAADEEARNGLLK